MPGTVYNEGPYSFTASGAVRKGRAVKIVPGSDQTVEECDTAGEASYGPAIDTVVDGEEVGVLRRGWYAEAVCGAAIAARNTDLTTDDEGRYVTAGVGDIIAGRNLTTTSAADELFTLDLDTAERVGA